MNTRTRILLALPLALAAAGASAAEPAKPAAKGATAAPNARFDKYDLDKNGVIDRDEFARLDADWHKPGNRKTQTDTDEGPVPDDTGIRGKD